MHSETKYLHNGSLYTLDELHALGILLSSTTPTKTTVYGRVSGQTGTRFVGSGGDVIVKTSSGLLFYYATQAACDEDWSTTEPFVIGYLNRASLYANSSNYVYSAYIGQKTGNPGPENDYNIPYDTSKTYTLLDIGSYNTSTGVITWGIGTSGSYLYKYSSSSKLALWYKGTTRSTTSFVVKYTVS